MGVVRRCCCVERASENDSSAMRAPKITDWKGRLLDAAAMAFGSRNGIEGHDGMARHGGARLSCRLEMQTLRG
jgi:hypothetical protein